LRVRFVDGFASVRESIMQLYSECNWRGQCSPLLMLQSAGSYPHAGNLQIAALRKISTDEKPAGNWITAAIMEDYKQDYTYFQNNQKSWRDKTRDLKCPISNSYFCKTQFVPMAHKNKWIKLLFIVSVKVEKVFISAQVKSPDGIWTIPNLKKLDRPPATLDPHIELGIYRPGSTSNSNPTSVIDFDYIKIKKISQAEFEQAQKEVYLTPGSLTKVDKTKYDRTKAGMEMRFKCFTDYARAKNLNDIPLQTEIETLITSFVGNNYYRSHRQIVKAGITQKSMDANKKALVRLVNYEGTNEEYCAKPVL